MKRQLLTLIAAAGMLLLGGVSAKADDGSWTITVAPTTGTFYRDSDGNTSSAWRDRWVSNESPTITIADADGSTTNNMTWDDTLDGITLAEGSGQSYSYTVSVEYGYLISGMELKAKTTVSDMTLTIGETTKTLTADTEATFTLSEVGTQSVGITVSSSSGSNESVTLYSWTVTVVEDPDAKDFSVDLSQMKITAISEAITSQPTEGKWYLIRQTRNGTSPAYDAGEGSTMLRAADDNVVQVGDEAEDVAQYLLRFLSADKTSTALEKSVVVNPQWGTGNFWTSSLTTTSDFGSAGSYNMYLTSSNSGTSTFAFNLYDMQDIVDNNGVSQGLAFWEKGEVTATSGNNVWWLYEVTLEEDESYFDLTHKKIAEIGDSITALPTDASQWYLMKNDRHSYSTYGYMTPAYDNGEGNTIMRAAEDHLKAGDPVEEVAQYLVRFLPTGETSTQLAKSTVVHLQWATGNYWTNSLTTSSHEADAASYNMYLTSDADNTSTFAFNLYDMQNIVDNNGVGAGLAFWETGTVTATSNANNIWWLYPVTFEEMNDDDDTAEAELIELREAIEEVQAAYDAYTVSGYNTNVETGFSGNNGVGNGLIKETSQFYSPYTSATEGSLDKLLDNDASTYWHSDWSDEGGVDNGVHYIEVDMADDFVGGPLLVNILRRSDANNDHVTKMRVTSAASASDETADTTWIADIDLPFEGKGTRVVAGFTCPYGVKTLRFYEEETYGSDEGGSNRGYFHLADFQLFYTTIDPDITGLISDELSALATAIATAQAKADDIINITTSDVDSLKEALAACQTAVEARTTSAPCTLTEAKWGTLILPFDYDAPGGIMAYTSTGVNEDNELNLTLVEDGKLTANTPYIIGGVASSYTLTSIKITEGSDNLTNGTLTGTFELMYAPAGSYVLQQHEGDEVPAFYKVADDNTIQVGAYHCYLNPQSGGEAKAVVYFPGTARDDDDNVATAIEAVDGITTDNEAIYDLSGRKVTNPRSGIYIKGGKKVIIK